MDTVFTIITPSFNQAAFLEAAIQSVLSQAGDFYIDFIIMDGGSIDGSVEIIKKFEQLLKENSDTHEKDGVTYYVRRKDSGLPYFSKGISYRWQSQSDEGQSAAINEALAKAKGNIFAYLNSDDVYQPYALQQVMDEFLASPDVQVVYGNAVFINAQGDVIGSYPSRDVNTHDLTEQCYLSQPSVFVRTSAIDVVGTFNPLIKNSLDYEYWLRLYSAGIEFKFISPILSATRIHGDTKTNRNQMQIKMECLALAKHYGGGEIPLSWRKAFVQDATILGILSSRVLSIFSKLRDLVMRLLVLIVYPAYTKKVEAEELRLFPPRSKPVKIKLPE